MSKSYDVAVLVGSLRKGSFNRMTAQAIASLAPASLQFRFVAYDDLQLYNQDLDNGPQPETWTRFRDEIRKADAVLFATPEYNRSIPGPLKNAIDIGSRPYGKSVWAGKPAGIVASSPSAVGGFGASNALRQSLACLDMPTMAQPETYLGHIDKSFDESGKLTSEPLREFLTKYATAFADWIARVEKK